MPAVLIALFVAELTVQEILARHIEAVGGEDAIRAVGTLRKTGTYVYNGVEHPLVSYHKIGRLSREEIDGLQIWGTSRREGLVVLRGTNGRAYWIRDQSREGEWRAIPASRAAIALDDADFHGPLFDFERKGNLVELEGLGEVDGTPAYRLRVRLASGQEEILSVDVGNFLVLKKEIAGEETERDLEQPRAWYYDDYRPVKGVLMPFRVFVEEPLFSREYTFENIEGNVEIDDAVFEPPPDAIQRSP